MGCPRSSPEQHFEQRKRHWGIVNLHNSLSERVSRTQDRHGESGWVLVISWTSNISKQHFSRNDGLLKPRVFGFYVESYRSSSSEGHGTQTPKLCKLTQMNTPQFSSVFQIQPLSTITPALLARNISTPITISPILQLPQQPPSPQPHTHLPPWPKSSA